MTEYIVKIGFCLRAYDSFNIEAASDAEAIEKSKTAAQVAMESTTHPEHIDMDERRDGIIAFIDRITTRGRQTVIEHVAFDNDRIQSAEAEAAIVRCSVAPSRRK
jgi:hypothetical protein